MNQAQFEDSKYKASLAELESTLNTLRKSTENPIDASLAEAVHGKHGVTLESFFADLGIDPNVDTVQNMVNLPDSSVRWLVPEIFRETLRLGLRKSPIYPNIIAAEVAIKGLNAVIPHFNMSAAIPKKVGIAETIPYGNVSYGSKQVGLGKMGLGIQIPYEVQQYVSLNLVSIFLQDFGIKMGMGMDAMAIDVLINGEAAGGAESAPVIGVASAGTLTYKDILKIWLRMSRIGRMPDSMIGGEDAALLTMDLAEFKRTDKFGTADKTLNLKTPLPTRANYFIHGNVPTNEQIIIDSGAALIKMNAQPLLVEQDKTISNQTMSWYASFTTGFATMYRDARVILDHSVAFSSNGFPAYMDPTVQENAVIN
jgi:hypothetical protein